MKTRFVAPADVFVCDLGDGVGSEQGGKRPVVVVSNSKCCVYSPTIQIVPITSKPKTIIPTHYTLLKETYQELEYDENTVLCEQVRTLDKNRLQQKIFSLSPSDFYKVIQCCKNNLPF